MNILLISKRETHIKLINADISLPLSLCHVSLDNKTEMKEQSSKCPVVNSLKRAAVNINQAVAINN